MAFITVSEIQRRFNLSRSVAYEFVRQLPPGIAIRFGPRTVRVDEEKLNSYLNPADEKAARGASPQPLTRPPEENPIDERIFQ